MNGRTHAVAGTVLATLAILSAIMMLLAPTGQAIWFINDMRVDHGSSNSQTPVIALNSTGVIVVLWSDDRNGTWDIMAANSADKGVSWSGDHRVDGSVGGNQTVPDVAISTNNRVHAVWQDARGATDHIYYASSTDGGVTFGTNHKVESSTSGVQGSPAIAVYATTEYVAWENSSTGDYDIYFSKSTDNGSTWTAPKRVDTAAFVSDQRYPDITVDGSGKIVIVWQDNRKGDWDIFSATSTDGGATWSTNQRIDDTAGASTDQERPSIAVDTGGRFHVMWQDYRSNSRYKIYYSNTTTPSTSWSIPNTLVSDAGSGDAKFPSVAVDKNGMVHGVWQDGRNSGGSPPDIYYSNSTSDWKFAANKRVDTSATGSQTVPCMSTDGKVSTFIVWQSNQNTKDNIFYTKNGNIQPDPPTYTAPANGAWLNTQTPTFNWTFTDPDPGDTQTAYQLQVYNISGTVYDSGIVVSSTGGLQLPTPLPDGIYSWKVKTRDTNSTWGVYNTPWTVNIDTVSPLVGTPADAGKWSSSSSLTWTWTAATDAGSGPAGYYICIDSTAGGCGVVNNAWTTSTQYTYIGGTDGTTYYAKVKAKDVAGNNGSFGGNSDGIAVDLTAPGAAAPTDVGKYTKSKTVTWTWTASTDTVSGVAGYYICVGTSPGGCNIISDDWTAAVQYSINNGSDGTTYYAKIKAKDNASNLGAYGGNSDGITVDLVAPSGGRPVDTGLFAFTTDIKFWWAPSVDSTSGIKGYFVYVGTLPDGKDAVDGAFVTQPNYTFLNAQNGKIYYAYIKAEDNATNIGLPSLSSDGITVDLTVPPAPVVNDEGLTNNTRQAQCWWDAVEDQESGVVKYQVQLLLDSTVIKQGNTTLTTLKFYNATPFLQHGKMYNLRVRALNGAGNWSAWGQSPGLWVDVQINDSLPATHDGLYSNSTSILWTWPAVVDVPGGIDGYLVSIGTSLGSDNMVSGAWTQTNSYLFTGGTNGQRYFITVKAKDKAGNLAKAIKGATAVTVDMEPPETGPVHDVGAFSPSSNITFTWDPFRDSISGIKGYYIAIGSAPGTDDILVTFTNKTIYVYKGALGGKTYYAKVRGVDNAGNIGWWGQPSDGIQIDITPPSDVSLVVPVKFANTVSYLYIEWTASNDDISGIQYYMFALGTTNGGTDLVFWTRANGTSAKATALSLQDGKTYYISVKAINGAGLEGNVLKVPVTIDTVPPAGPTVQGYKPYTGNTTITWRWSGATDDRSGIDGYLFSLGTAPGLADLVNGTFISGESYTFNSGINDRVYYATIVPIDKAGNKGTVVRGLSVTVDLLPPRVIRVDRAGPYSHSKNVTWSWVGSDSISGIDGYWVVVSEGDFTNGTPLLVKADKYSLTKDLLEGHTYYIQVRPVDKAGNMGEYAYGEAITIDSVAPTATVTLNNNATYVPSRDVTLQIVSTHKDVAFMLVSNNQALTGAVWEPFVASRVWYLTPGDGLKEVYLVVRDASGLISPTYKVQTTLKTSPPKLDVALPGDVVASSDITISGKTDPGTAVTVNDKPVKVEDDGKFSTTVHLKDGTNLIRVVAKDQAGNEISVTRAVNKEPLAVPSWMLFLLVMVLLLISIIGLAYAYSANRRLAAMKNAPEKKTEPKTEERPQPKVRERPQRPAPVEKEPVRKAPPPRQEIQEVEEEELEAVEEAPDDDELTLEENGAVKRPDILARIRATEDTDTEQIKAAEAEDSDDVTLEMTEGPSEKAGEPKPATPIAQVRCNQCSNLIPIYTTERPLRIECTNCGKVGMIRK